MCDVSAASCLVVNMDVELLTRVNSNWTCRVLYVVVCCALCVVCFVPGVDQAKHRKDITKTIGKSHQIFKNCGEIASLERLRAPLSAP